MRWTLCAAVAGICAAPAWLGGQTPVVQWQPQASGVTVRLRGVSAVSPTVAWASGAGGTVLRTTDGGKTWVARPVPDADALDFRDVDAMSAEVAHVLSIGPGEASRIYQTMDGGATWTRRFSNTEPTAFFDAMAFADPVHGAAVSDAVDGRFVVRLTRDGGRTWLAVPADRLPPALSGEGAFAASGTNVAMAGPDHIWIGTPSRASCARRTAAARGRCMRRRSPPARPRASSRSPFATSGTASSWAATTRRSRPRAAMPP